MSKRLAMVAVVLSVCLVASAAHAGVIYSVNCVGGGYAGTAYYMGSPWYDAYVGINGGSYYSWTDGSTFIQDIGNSGTQYVLGMNYSIPPYAGVATLSNMFAGFIQNYNTGGGIGMATWAVTNPSLFTPGTDYEVQLWAWDGTRSNGTLAIMPGADFNTANAIASVSYTTALPTSDNDYSATFTATATENGDIVFSIVRTSGGSGGYPYTTNAILNGFRISSIESNEIPEPATLLLVGTGVLGVFGYARRRMMK